MMESMNYIAINVKFLLLIFASNPFSTLYDSIPQLHSSGMESTILCKSLNFMFVTNAMHFSIGLSSSPLDPSFLLLLNK